MLLPGASDRSRAMRAANGNRVGSPGGPHCWPGDEEIHLQEQHSPSVELCHSGPQDDWHQVLLLKILCGGT